MRCHYAFPLRLEQEYPHHQQQTASGFGLIHASYVLCVLQLWAKLDLSGSCVVPVFSLRLHKPQLMALSFAAPICIQSSLQVKARLPGICLSASVHAICNRHATSDVGAVQSSTYK
mmetsp:Transcript_14338/g.25037  ORF Transcript_14338/g.25037 Transcript_14338/m.25037 type:complete len:116 (+) Transcript_14338:2530-2877(+)